MPKYNDRKQQTTTITAMHRLCNLDLLHPMSIDAAATQLSTIGRASGLSDMSQTTYRRWYTHWSVFAMLPCDTPAKYISNTSATWTTVSLAELKRVVDTCPVLYLDEIASKLKTTLGLKFSAISISRALRRKLHYSRKLVYEKASQQIAEDKDDFIAALKLYLATPDMAIFVDESHKDRKAARRRYGWSPIGCQVNYRAQFDRDIRYTLIGAADCFGFVIPACDIILHQYKEKEEQKPVDADRFVEYIRDTLVPLLGNFARGEPHSVVIMDNCSIHMDSRVRELIEGAGAIIVYSAPYAPELIPIEYMFHQWKAFLKKYYVEFNYNWIEVHNLALMSVTREQGLNYF